MLAALILEVMDRCEYDSLKVSIKLAIFRHFISSVLFSNTSSNLGFVQFEDI